MTDLTLYKEYTALGLAHRIAFLEHLHRDHADELMYSSMSDSERKVWSSHFGRITKELTSDSRV